MRVVLDSDVVVQGVLTGECPCGQVLCLAIDWMVLEPCVDSMVLWRYDELLFREELSLPRVSVERLRRAIRSMFQYVNGEPLGVKLPDSDDVCFLEVAAAAEARLVTGSVWRFPPSQRAGVTVLTPRELLDLVKQATSEGKR